MKPYNHSEDRERGGRIPRIEHCTSVTSTSAELDASTQLPIAISETPYTRRSGSNYSRHVFASGRPSLKVDVGSYHSLLSHALTVDGSSECADYYIYT